MLDMITQFASTIPIRSAISQQRRDISVILNVLEQSTAILALHFY